MPINKNLFDTNFSFPFKLNVANNVRIATKAFDLFWESNSQFLNRADELRGRILAYAVKQQFINSAPSTAPYYIVSNEEINSYKSNAVFLNTTDYTTCICRTEKPQKLPCKAAYKLRLAVGNREDDVQMEFAISNKDQLLKVSLPKKFAILGYRYADGKLQHLNIVVPDWKFENILYSENLLGHINEFYNYMPEELVEERVAALKDNLLQKVKFENK